MTKWNSSPSSDTFGDREEARAESLKYADRKGMVGVNTGVDRRQPDHGEGMPECLSDHAVHACRAVNNGHMPMLGLRDRLGVPQ